MLDVDIFIFDWSGTISDDFDSVVAATNKLLEAFGLKSIDKDYIRKNYRPDYMDFYRDLGLKASKNEINRIFTQSFLSNRIKPKIIPNAKDVLEWLYYNGKKIFVISSQQPELIIAEAGHFGVESLVTKFYTDSLDKKSDVEKIISANNANPKKIVFVGDTFVDVEAGKAAGVNTVAVLSGYQDEEILRKYSPDFLIKDVGGLKKIINQRA